MNKLYNKTNFKKYFILLMLSTWAHQSQAYFTTAESGDIVPEGQYRVTVEPQFNYFGVSAHFDAGTSEDSQIRVSAGAGQSGYNFDFYYKRIPYPDYDKQPAIGFKYGASFAKIDGSSVITPRFFPMISKSIMIDNNRWTPYLSLPIGVSVSQSKSTTPTHFVMGCEITPSNIDNIQFGAEMGLNIRDSFSYISGFISFFFEPTEKISETR